LVLSILALLGETTKPALPAITLLQLKDEAQRSFPTAAAGLPLRLGDSNPPLIFTLDQDLTLLPVQTISVSVDGKDHSNDLAQLRPVPLIASGRKTAQVTIALGLTEKIPAATTGTLSLMLELATPAAIAAQWSPQAVADVPPPATLAFSYGSVPNGTKTAFKVDDGTAGLRRSGVLRIPITDWQAASSAGPPYVYVVSLQIAGAGYTEPPSLLRVLPNVVSAQHRWARTKHPVTKGWLPLPGNVISLAAASGSSSYMEFPPIENSVTVKITERDGATNEWKVVPDLSFAEPSDRVCLVDRVKSEIRFGDGLTGRLPVLVGKQDSEIEVAYQAGGGLAGNIGENLPLWVAIKADPAAPDPKISAVNVVSGEGGQESESVAAARKRAQAAINDRNRTVTKDDYENLAQTTPGVAIKRAYAAIGRHPDFPCTAIQGAVTVFVVPYARRDEDIANDETSGFVSAPQPDDGALQAVQNRLAAGRLIGSQIFVEGPVYRSVRLSLQIAADSQLAPVLQQRIVASLGSFLDPLVGGDGHTGWPFGGPVRPSALTREVQNVLVKAGTVLQVSVSLDGMDPPESCKDVPIRPHELLKLDAVELHVQRRAAAGGGLR